MEDEQTCRMIDAYLSIFGNRWNLLILNELFNGPKRFNELKRALSPITQTVLVRHLKTLEEMEVIALKIARDLGLQPGDPIVMSCGTPTGAGKTNTMRILMVNAIRELE